MTIISAQLSEVRNALTIHGKLSAIKLYREMTGESLVDSKFAVEWMEREIAAEKSAKVTKDEIAIRDYFAAQAMSGFAWHRMHPTDMARHAYEAADAMLAQRVALEAALGGK